MTATGGPSGGHVVLIGLSGSGKTTVGRLLARELGRAFVDTDDVVEAIARRPITAIFEQDGEPAFRAIERRAVTSALTRDPAVVATGGGAPLHERSREDLWRGNTVIWLEAPVEVLAQRVGAAGEGRPLLSGGAVERLRGLAAEREPVYATAHLRLGTAGRPPEGVVADILEAIRAGQERGVDGSAVVRPDEGRDGH